MVIESSKYAVTIVSPVGFKHTAVFTEVAVTIHHALVELGYESIITKELRLGYRPIILGVNLLPLTDWVIPDNAILYNFEQIFPNSPWLSDALLALFRQHILWDYSQANCKQLILMGFDHVEYVPLGVVPQLQQIKPRSPQEKDIDVLFYGSSNDRRLKILDELENQGIKTVHVYGIYGTERDALIARSKIVLNLHYYETEIFEIVRVSYLLANQIFVVSEVSPNCLDAQELAPGIAFASYENIVETCLYYLEHESEREAIAQKGHELIQQRQETDILQVALENSHILPSQRLRVDIGCGTRKPAGFIGVDSYPGLGVDIVADLSGKFPFSDNSVDTLRGYDIIEHLPDRIHTMNEIWRVCKPGAVVDLLVPSSDGRGAFQDPTHISFWNINSFYYFTVENLAYLELCQRYGFEGSFSLIHLEEITSPGQVIHVRALLRVVKDHQSAAYKKAHLLPPKPLIMVVCPDWRAALATIYESLKQILHELSQHPDASSMGLIIDVSPPLPSPDEITPEELLLDVATSLLLDQEIDIEERGIDLCFLACEDGSIWHHVKSRISYHIGLEAESRVTQQVQTVPTIQRISPLGLSQQPLRLRFGLNPVKTIWLQEQVTDPRILVGDFSVASSSVAWNLSDLEAEIHIGKFCQFGERVSFCDASYLRASALSTYPLLAILGDAPECQALFPGPKRKSTSTRIGHDVNIGLGAVLGFGITIGDGAIVMPGAVVLEDIPPFSIVAGNPGQVIGYRFSPEKIAQIQALAWWHWPLEKIVADGIFLLESN